MKAGDDMPWKEFTKPMSREEFVKRVLAHEASKSQLCREYGISRPTGDKWIRRYLDNQALVDRSHRAFRTPNKVDEEIEKKVLALRTERPAYGSVKLRRMLQNRGEQGLPCSTTFNAILKRNGCISRAASVAATPVQRFEYPYPNDMWQADFKGHFAMLSNALRCHPLNILDDRSRFCLCNEALVGESLDLVWPIVLRLFREYGLPRIFLCDHGTPWGTGHSGGFTVFEVLLMELGVLTVHGRVRHPQTQGKEESFNRSMKRELLAYTSIQDLQDAQQHFDQWREHFNHERPHHALNLDCPAQHYCKSKRTMPSLIKPWQYPDDYELRKIASNGLIYYQGKSYFLSESFIGKTIGIRPSRIADHITLCFREFTIARINLNTNLFTQKRIYLAEGDPRRTVVQGLESLVSGYALTKPSNLAPPSAAPPSHHPLPTEG